MFQKYGIFVVKHRVSVSCLFYQFWVDPALRSVCLWCRFSGWIRTDLYTSEGAIACLKSYVWMRGTDSWRTRLRALWIPANFYRIQCRNFHALVWTHISLMWTGLLRVNLRKYEHVETPLNLQ